MALKRVPLKRVPLFNTLHIYLAVPVLNSRLSVPLCQAKKRGIFFSPSLLGTERWEFKTNIRYYMPEYIIWEKEKDYTLVFLDEILRKLVTVTSAHGTFPSAFFPPFPLTEKRYT